jgi:ribosomal protein S8
MATVYTSVDIDVDIEIDEFVDSCNDRDIKNLLRYLSEEGYLNKFNIKDETKMSANEIQFRDKMSLLSDKYYQMSVEETELIENLYNKYR